MNILYRPVCELKLNVNIFEKRLEFYQTHYYDNIYYTSEDGKYIGFQNYQKEIQGRQQLVAPIDYSSSTKFVYDWFLKHPGQFRLPVLKEGYLCGEYYESLHEGQILYKNIEDRAQELLPLFEKEKNEFLNHLSCAGLIMDTKLIPQFRHLVDHKNKKLVSPSEILQPILINKLLDYYNKKGVHFIIVNGLMKKSLKDVSDSERKRLDMSVEQVMQDSGFIARFCGDDALSYKIMSLHKGDLNQLARVVSNGVCNILLDRKEDHYNIINGKRYTTDVPYSASQRVHMFGPCSVMGLCVADEMTICSILQRHLNGVGYDAKVYNHGLAYGNDQLNDLVAMMDEPVRSGDCVIWFSAFDKINLSTFENQSIPIVDVAQCVKGLKDWYLDNPFHCNGQANSRIAAGIFNHLKNIPPSHIASESSSLIDSMKIDLHHNPYSILNSTELNSYEEYLEQFRCSSNVKIKGAVVLNANPCTLGHLYLIKEALKYVDFLYVFLVEDSTGNLPYIEREFMLKESLKYNKRVRVIRGGSIMTSEKIFPEYFNRSSKPSKVSLVLAHRCFGQVVSKKLGVTYRFFGTEPNDPLTRALNESACEILPKYGIKPIFVERMSIEGKYVSAKNVRLLLEDKLYSKLARLVPFSTYKRLLKMSDAYSDDNLAMYFKNANYTLLTELVDSFPVLNVTNSDILLNSSCYPGKFEKYGCCFKGNNSIIKIARNESQRLSLSSEKLGQILCNQMGVLTSEITTVLYQENVAQISKNWMEVDKFHFFPLSAYFEELLDSPSYNGCVTFKYDIFKQIMKEKCKEGYEEILETFWRVFIIDFLLCNPRSAGNIGFLNDGRSIKLSPNYDNSTDLRFIGDTSFMEMGFPRLLMNFGLDINNAYFVINNKNDKYLKSAIDYAKEHLNLNSIFEGISSKEDRFLFDVIEYRYNKLVK